MRAAFVIVIGLVAGVLGYGYWHRSSHATLTVVLTDTSRKERDGRVLNAELVFLDASSRPLARGKTDDKLGIVLLQHPASGYCGPELSLDSYRACVIAQSGWLTGWVNDLRYVSVVIGNCRIERVPVEVTVLRDRLYTWWVPLRDVGGVPYTRYATRLEVDVRVCAVTGYRG
jgi:hypothetical protein